MVGGGTAGHLTPLHSLAREVKRQSPGCQLVYIGQTGERFDDVLDKTLFDKSFTTKAGKLRRYPLTFKTLILNIRDAWRVVVGFFQALSILSSVKPDAVFSKGSFVAVPIILASRIKRIPVITHDSDTVPGLANRMAGNQSVRATGMPADLYDYPSTRTHYVGIPVDEHFYLDVPEAKRRQYLRDNQLPTDAFILLVEGGSLGAGAINQKLPLIADDLIGQIPKLYIVHIAGSKHVISTKQDYKTHLSHTSIKQVKVLGFSNKLYSLTAVANLVITRAGATSLAELAAQKRASMVVPSPFLAAGHQLENAKWLKAHDAVEVLDNNSTPQEWLTAIVRLANNKKRLDILSTNLGSLAKPDAAGDLATLIISVAKG